MATGGDVFRIVGGELQINGVLEAGTRYDVVAQTEGGGSDGKTIRMVVVVLHPNDPPVVATRTEPVGLSKTVEVGDVVAVIEATDPNLDDSLFFAIASMEQSEAECSDPNVSFEPIDDSVNYPFSMESAEGVLLLRQPLADLMGMSCYRLVIEVSDSAVVSLSGRAEIQVVVGGE